MVAQRALVQRVEILSGCEAGPDLGVDLRRSQAIGQRRVRDDPPLARLGREVALEGHTHHVGAGAHGEEDLRGRGEEGDDAHRWARYQPPPGGRPVPNQLPGSMRQTIR